MHRHCGWLIVALLAPALTGCLTSQMHRPGSSGGAFNTVPNSTNAAKAPVALPPKEGASVCISLGEQFQKAGDYGEAIAQYEKARTQDPSQKQLGRKLAVLYDRAGDSKKALEEYNAALKLTPKDADLHNDFGYYYSSRGNWKAAETEYRAALALDPKHARATVNLGQTLAHQERYDEAMTLMANVVTPAEAKANVAFVLTTQGKVNDAKAAYRSALALDPELKIARDALQKLDNPDPALKGTSPLVVGDRPPPKPATKETARRPGDLPELAAVELGLSPGTR